MLLKNIARRTVCAFLPIIAAASFSRAQTDQSPVSITPQDLELAKQRVLAFTAEWKANNIDTAYMMMCEDSRAVIPQAVFLAVYSMKQDGSGKISSFSLKEALPEELGINVKVELTFNSEIVPSLINGVHTFHLIHEHDKWMVKTIVPPIVPPTLEGSGGGHPGD